MFLRCSYFFQNLSLDVLINKVLIQNNACIQKIPFLPKFSSNGGHFGYLDFSKYVFTGMYVGMVF